MLAVPIKEEFLKCLPFPLRTRIGLATVFSYYGHSGKVENLMQKASHTTRAYYVNANRLKGFVVQYTKATFLSELVVGG